MRKPFVWKADLFDACLAFTLQFKVRAIISGFTDIMALMQEGLGYEPHA